MDLTEEKVSFDQMPTVVSELKQEISGLKTLVRTTQIYAKIVDENKRNEPLPTGARVLFAFYSAKL